MRPLNVGIKARSALKEERYFLHGEQSFAVHVVIMYKKIFLWDSQGQGELLAMAPVLLRRCLFRIF